MELLIIFIVIVAIIAGFVAFFERLNKSKTSGQPWSSPDRTNSSVPFRQSPQQLYFYSRKDDIMTSAEWRFFGRLNVIAADKYYVFPQIHLSSLLRNETKGKYFKLAFQRINRRSVDFVLCDIETHKPIYAVELDDWSHDSAKRQARDGVVEEMLGQVGLPLVRFRNVEKMSDDDITNKFREANYATNGDSSKG